MEPCSPRDKARKKDRDMVARVHPGHDAQDSIDFLKRSVLASFADYADHGGPKRREAVCVGSHGALDFANEQEDAVSRIEGKTYRDTLHELCRVFTAACKQTGSASQKSRKHRLGNSTLNQLLSEVGKTHALGYWSVVNLNENSKRQLQSALCQRIERSTLQLYTPTLQGGNLDGAANVASDNHNWKIHVWPDSVTAQQAVLKIALAARFGTVREAPVAAVMTGAPQIVLIREVQRHVQSRQDSSQTTAPHNAEARASCDAVLKNWQCASQGIAVVQDMHVESSEDMMVSVEKHLSESDLEGQLAPILIVVHMGIDSVLHTAVDSIRLICERHNCQLHVEGKALASLANTAIGRYFPSKSLPFEPPTSIMLEPGTWLGIPCCAVATLHTLGGLDSEQIGKRTHANSLRAGIEVFSSSAVMKLSSQVVISSSMSLWVLFSRVGLKAFEDIHSRAFLLTSKLAKDVGELQNMEATVCGYGSSVRISFALSRAERHIQKYKAKQHTSMVNKAIFEDIWEESDTGMLDLRSHGDDSFILFSPSALIRDTNLLRPSRELVSGLHKRLEDATLRYEVSSLGSSPFNGHLRGAADVDVVTEQEIGAASHFCYGAFRVVPEELSGDWASQSENITTVGALTFKLAEALADELRRCGFRDGKSTHDKRNTRETKRHGGKANPAPFDYFLHAENEDGIPDFLTAEVRAGYTPKNPGREADQAARIVVQALRTVVDKWRSSSGIAARSPYLANIAGLDTYTSQNGSIATPGLVKKSESEVAWLRSGEEDASRDVRSVLQRDSVNATPQLNERRSHSEEDEIVSALDSDEEDGGRMSSYGHDKDDDVSVVPTTPHIVPGQDFPRARQQWLGGGSTQKNAKKSGSGSRSRSKGHRESGSRSRNDDASSSGSSQYHSASGFEDDGDEDEDERRRRRYRKTNEHEYSGSDDSKSRSSLSSESSDEERTPRRTGAASSRTTPARKTAPVERPGWLAWMKGGTESGVPSSAARTKNSGRESNRARGREDARDRSGTDNRADSDHGSYSGYSSSSSASSAPSRDASPSRSIDSRRRGTPHSEHSSSSSSASLSSDGDRSSTQQYASSRSSSDGSSTYAARRSHNAGRKDARGGSSGAASEPATSRFGFAWLSRRAAPADEARSATEARARDAPGSSSDSSASASSRDARRGAGARLRGARPTSPSLSDDAARAHYSDDSDGSSRSSGASSGRPSDDSSEHGHYGRRAAPPPPAYRSSWFGGAAAPAKEAKKAEGRGGRGGASRRYDEYSSDSEDERREAERRRSERRSERRERAKRAKGAPAANASGTSIAAWLTGRTAASASQGKRAEKRSSRR